MAESRMRQAKVRLPGEVYAVVKKNADEALRSVSAEIAYTTVKYYQLRGLAVAEAPDPTLRTREGRARVEPELKRRRRVSARSKPSTSSRSDTVLKLAA